jgi:hypothetical protein
VTEVVAWAASNGDRSENADHQYGKRRLRQIDGRIRFLTKRIEAAEVVDPEAPRAGPAATRAFFGATVRYSKCRGSGASGEHRGHRRDRSQPQPHQLGATCVTRTTPGLNAALGMCPWSISKKLHVA